jgi:hypothetical protein
LVPVVPSLFPAVFVVFVSDLECRRYGKKRCLLCDMQTDSIPCKGIDTPSRTGVPKASYRSLSARNQVMNFMTDGLRPCSFAGQA